MKYVIAVLIFSPIALLATAQTNDSVAVDKLDPNYDTFSRLSECGTIGEVKFSEFSAQAKANPNSPQTKDDWTTRMREVKKRIEGQIAVLIVQKENARASDDVNKDQILASLYTTVALIKDQLKKVDCAVEALIH